MVNAYRNAHKNRLNRTLLPGDDPVYRRNAVPFVNGQWTRFRSPISLEREPVDDQDADYFLVVGK